MSILRRERGFTIVELLIVIVVIAILAAVTIVAYNGIQGRAKNAAIENAVSTYRKALTLYDKTYGGYALPGTSAISYCLGEVSAYPSSCYSASADTTFATELKKVISSLPAPDGDCLSYGASCRRNFTLTRAPTWTVDGSSHLYYIFYFLNGTVKCSLANSLEGSWGTFSTTQTKGYFERSGTTTMCVLGVADPS
jgi:prepilin-type N-terminal cleavage/methylation domain-containing protein